MYNAANSQQSNTYQYPTDKKVRKLFEVSSYVPVKEQFVNSVPEHVSTPESYHSMTHINFILKSSAYSRDLRFSQW